MSCFTTRSARKPKGLGTIWADQLRPIAGGGEHLARFGGVHRHAGFREDVLPRLQRRQRDRAVQIRPRADQHGVQIGVGHEIGPPLVRFGNAELRRRGRRGLRPPVADGGNLHIGARPQPRHVPELGVASQTDDPHANHLGSHTADFRRFFCLGDSADG
jgi:hypothetical protein